MRDQVPERRHRCRVSGNRARKPILCHPDGADESISARLRLGIAENEAAWHGNQRVERLIYSGDKMVDKLTADEDGMDIHEALEYIEFNIEGGYLGIDTPILVWPQDEWDGEE